MKDELRSEPFYVWIPQSILGFIIQLLKVAFEFIVSVFTSLYDFLKNVGKAIVGIAKRTYQGIRFYSNLFIKGSYKTKLSFLFMGFGAYTNGQIVKGIIYQLGQIVSLILLVFFFGPYMSKLTTLGDTIGTPVTYDPGNPNADPFGYVPAVPGDNSMIILLLSVGGIILAVLLYYFYLQNIRLASANEVTLSLGKRPIGFKEELQQLLNERFHITVLSWPVFFSFIFTVLPLVFMILIAFTEFDRFHQPPGSLFTWVGLDNDQIR